MEKSWYTIGIYIMYIPVVTERATTFNMYHHIQICVKCLVAVTMLPSTSYILSLVKNE